MTTVKEAIEAMIRSRVVDTGKVSGLSRDVIVQMNTLQTGILINFESLSGIVSSNEPHLNLYLQAGARECLRAALREGISKQPTLKMTINSGYRTVAQQYVLYQIYRRDPKLIPLAAVPGNSNHEDGLAIDVNNYNAWKPYLLAHGWQWQGSRDPVHFFSSGRSDVGNLGVKAFQSLWNKHNPTEQMTVDGNFGEQTAAKMDRTPISGFASATSVFHQGDTGEQIVRIQQALTNAGFPVSIDGVFDRSTVDAVIKFQLKKGLSADGSIGPITLRKLGIVL